MIEPVLREIRNYYFYGEPIKADGITNNAIECDTSQFEQGQYVYIHKHPKYTGVYKITLKTADSIHIGYPTKLPDEDSTEMIELANSSKQFKVYPLAIPDSLLQLVKQIEQFNKDNPNGVASESLGDYSVSYSAKDGVASWQAAFSSQLANYRSVYLEMPR